MKKKALLSAGVVTAGLMATIVGTSMAASNSTSSDTSLVAKIAKQFNLNQQDVQKVFDQDKTEHEAAHKAQVETELTKAVTDGKITAEQKTKILAKITEMQTQRVSERDSMKDKTEAERKAAMDANRIALQKWATDNSIPTEFLRYAMGGGHGHGGPGGFGGRMGDPIDSSTGTSSSSSSSTSQQ